MKKTILCLFAFLSVLALSTACDDEGNELQSEGVITGYDLRLCACCGGYFIDIDSVAYLSDLTLEHSLDITPENLPLEVYLDWEIITPSCGENRILVTAIEER